MGESGVVDDPTVTTSDGAFLPWFIGCDASSTTNGAVCSVVTATVSDDALARCRRRKKIMTTAMETTAMPPTAPATMAPVFELLPPEGEGVVVGFGEVLVAWKAVEELEALINSPGSISGLSRNADVMRPKRGWRGESTTSRSRLVGIPSILELACTVSSYQKNIYRNEQ